MKPLIPLLAASMLSVASHAQNGFYFTASGGAGKSNVQTNVTFYDQNAATAKQSGISGFNAKLGVGYRYKNWRFQAGVQYLRTGYELKGLLFGSSFDPTLATTAGNGSYTIRFDHFGIPLQAGYRFSLTKKLGLMPSLGLLTTYNAGATSRISENGENGDYKRWPGATFKERYNQISLWGTAALCIDYSINSKIGIFAGPSVQYMVSNFEKQPTRSTVFSHAEHAYAAGLDLGITFNL